MYYAGAHEPVWVDKGGWTSRALGSHRRDQASRRLGARMLPTSTSRRSFHRRPDAPQSEAKLADAELGLSLAVLKYARYARGGRIEDPATQLSSYLDRKPQLRRPFLVMTESRRRCPDDYLRKAASPAPAVREAAPAVSRAARRRHRERVDIPTKGNKLYPGTTHQDIALVRERLGVPRPSTAEPSFMTTRSSKRVKAFQTKRDISPANGIINAKTRRAFNEGKQVRPSTLARQHGRVALDARGPRRDLRVGQHPRVHGARRQRRAGRSLGARHRRARLDKQTPIFSEDMRDDLLPSALERAREHQGEGDPAEPGARRRLLPPPGHEASAQRPRDQPRASTGAGPISATTTSISRRAPAMRSGMMKFTFPNKHSVYMHDTQSKGLFE